MDAGIWIALGGLVLVILGIVWRQSQGQSRIESRVTHLEDRRRSYDQWRAEADQRLSELARVPEALQRLDRALVELRGELAEGRTASHALALLVARQEGARQERRGEE